MKIMFALLMSVFMVLGYMSHALADAEADVKAAYAAWNEAFNAGDAAKIAAAYTDDAMFLPPTHDVIKGPSEIETFFAGLLSNGVSGHDLEVIQVMEDGDEVIAAAKWSAKAKDSAGAENAIGGIATHVFQRQGDGSLKLKLHTFN